MAAFEQLAFGFEEGAGAAVPAGTSPVAVQPGVPALAQQSAHLHPLRPAQPAARPAARPATQSTPAPLTHPRAIRDVLLAGQRVRYAFRRGKRRTIGFVVGPEGLSVSAPRWVGLGEVESALQEKAVWILRKLQEQGERSRRLQSARIVWADGACVPYLGRPVQLKLDAAGVSAPDGVCLEAADGGLDADPKAASMPVLRLGLPADAQAERIRDVVHSWWQRQAKRLFEERCQLYAQRLGVRVKRLSLSAAQTRWGSATADGSVRLNWRLIQFPLSAVDYVVVHELAHLREMNHSAAFWDVVRSVLPAYHQAQEPLKQALHMGD
jgi:predicted metal-dependent hydrolase